MLRWAIIQGPSRARHTRQSLPLPKCDLPLKVTRLLLIRSGVRAFLERARLCESLKPSSMYKISAKDSDYPDMDLVPNHDVSGELLLLLEPLAKRI